MKSNTKSKCFNEQLTLIELIVIMDGETDKKTANNKVQFMSKSEMLKNDVISKLH